LRLLISSCHAYFTGPSFKPDNVDIVTMITHAVMALQGIERVKRMVFNLIKKFGHR
jgi:hypothetical protein